MDQNPLLGRASHTPICSRNPCLVPNDIPWSQHEFPCRKEQPGSEDEVQGKKLLMAGGRRCSQLPQVLPESHGRAGDMALAVGDTRALLCSPAPQWMELQETPTQDHPRNKPCCSSPP